MKKTIALYFCLSVMLISNTAVSQISGKYYGEKEDFKKMAKRTMIVEVFEEDPDVIKRLSKKESRADQLKEYKTFISSYNAMMKICVPKYWTYNTKVEYKTTKEIEDLRKSKTDKYVLLSYFELTDSDMDYIERSSLSVPALKYTRIEEPTRKPDYKIYIPSSFVRSGNSYLEADMKIALLGMQANIKDVIKNDKTIQFQDFTEKEAEKNCSKLKGYTLLMEKGQLWKKTSAEEAQSALGSKIEWVSESDINKNILEGTKGKAVLFAIPYAIAKGGVGPISTSALGYFKIVVDCETSDILWSNNPGNMPIGKNITQYMMEDEFKNMKKCKF